MVTAHGNKRPYGAKLVFQISHARLIGDLENVSVLLESGAIALIEPARRAPWDGGRMFQVTLTGFTTATMAEAEGQHLAQSLLLLAASLNFGLRLIYFGRLSAGVYERFRPEGFSIWGEGGAAWPASVVLRELVSANRVNPLDPPFVVSMELYCSALLEANARARFLGIVSALEPLAEQQPLGNAVDNFVDSMIRCLDADTDIEPALRSSLRGRLQQLRRESVRQALLRLAKTWFPEQHDIQRQIDRAYALRSDLLHNGVLSDPDSDLGTETSKIMSILRAIYSIASNHVFHVPVGA